MFAEAAHQIASGGTGNPIDYAESAVQILEARTLVRASTTTLRVADLEMDLLKRTVRRGGQRIDLQPKEFQLLEFLLRRADQVVTPAAAAAIRLRLARYWK